MSWVRLKYTGWFIYYFVYTVCCDVTAIYFDFVYIDRGRKSIALI